MYATDTDGSLIVTATNGGADRAPGWLHNIEADGSIEAQIGRGRLTGIAEVIGPQHAEYARLWTLVNRNGHGRYDRYQQRTDRVIKLVRLQLR